MSTGPKRAVSAEYLHLKEAEVSDKLWHSGQGGRAILQVG